MASKSGCMSAGTGVSYLPPHIIFGRNMTNITPTAARKFLFANIIRNLCAPATARHPSQRQRSHYEPKAPRGGAQCCWGAERASGAQRTVWVVLQVHQQILPPRFASLGRSTSAVLALRSGEGHKAAQGGCQRMNGTLGEPPHLPVPPTPAERSAAVSSQQPCSQGAC